MFCCDHGAPHLFDLIFACMTSSHHTRARKKLNEKRAVALILQLCFGLSQKCSFFQVDNSILLRFAHSTQQQIDTSSCSMTVDRTLHNYANSNTSTVTCALNDAIENRK